MNNNIRLQQRLRQAGRRLWLIGTARAVAWGLFAAVISLLFAAWLDLLWELSPAARTALLRISVAAAAVLLVWLACRTTRFSSPAELARQLDVAANSSGEILTGWELDRAIGGGSLSPDRNRKRNNIQSLPLTAGLATMATQRAGSLAWQAPLAKAIPAKPLGRALAGLAALAVAIGGTALAMPALVKTEWSRFATPLADIPPYSALRFTLTPGNTKVLFGDDLEIAATVEGGAADHLELVVENGAGIQTSLPMFSEAGGSWRAELSKLTESTQYFVRCYRARSEKFKIDIITVPRIETVRVLVVPPEYAGQPNYEGPVPDEGVKGLRGTKVTLWATSNRPLSGGTLIVDKGRIEKGRPAKQKPEELAMSPTEAGGQEVVGQFEIASDGRFEFQVIDAERQPSKQSFAANVTLVADQYPIVRILRPPAQSLATPTAVLPVVISAEDDCGISRLELYRSLNHSRPLPVAVRMPAKAPHRRDEQISMSLEGYGLAPGDELSFFARVEDNDPAGAKGSESPLVTVKIISQEEFEHMLRVRQGMEALASKYRQAQRRLEGLTKKLEGLRKKLKDAPADSKLAEQTRKDLHELQRLMRREAAELRKSASHHLPFDVDGKLSPEIGNAAEMTEKMAAELEKLEKQLEISNKDMDKLLAQLAAKLQGQRQDFAQGAMVPMELLEVVFPLIADQQRFVLLAAQQEDLAQRMESLKGHDGEDNPALKARMRDLEHEQHLIRLELDRLLGDIEDHAARLPDRPELEQLKSTAQQFVKDVRGSGAAEALSDSENALADFAGTRAHDKAAEAAAILNRFVSRCESEGGMGQQGQGALQFQPSLAKGLGNTVAQMLAEMGLNNGSGGMPGRGDMGLYGDLASMEGSGSGQAGEPNAGAEGRGGEGGNTGGGSDHDLVGPGDAAADGTAAASSEANVPLRYRRAVRQYFQRLGQELGERPPSHDSGSHGK